MCSWPHPYSTLTLGCSRCTRLPMLGVNERMSLMLFGRGIIFEEFQPMWSRYLNVTERRTDRQTTCNLITAPCVASRGKHLAVRGESEKMKATEKKQKLLKTIRVRKTRMKASGQTKIREGSLVWHAKTRNTLDHVTNLMYTPRALFPRLFLKICFFVLSLYTVGLLVTFPYDISFESPSL